MKGFCKVNIPTLFLLFIWLSFADALDVPENPQGRITDFTSTLSLNEISFLDQKLADFEKQTTNQIAVLMIPSLEGDNLEDYSIRLADEWKIGQKGKDNGVILLIVKNDRKLRIEVGYGLEAQLPDSLAGSVIRNDIVPYFEKGNFYEGINHGINEIIKAISPGFSLETVKNHSVPHPGFPTWLIVFMVSIGGIIISIVFFGVIMTELYEWRSAKSRGVTKLGFLAYLIIGSDGARWREGYSSGVAWLGGFSGGRGGFLGGGGGFSGGGGGFGGGGASGGW